MKIKNDNVRVFSYFNEKICADFIKTCSKLFIFYLINEELI